MSPRVASLAAFALMLLVSVSGCLDAEDLPDPDEIIPPPLDDIEDIINDTVDPEPIDPNTLPGTRFVAVGDQGTGYAEQHQVAAAMHAVCVERGCDFAVGLGDNIYEIGAVDANDPQFDEKFEEPYANFSIPFYMVQGNHDNSNDPIANNGGPAIGEQIGIGHWYGAGNVEVDYHYRDDRASDKWYMPDRYYDVNNGNVSLLAMDTNLLMYWGLGLQEDVAGLPSPMEQEAWFEEALGRANAPWVLAIGHHPYLSNGEHGNAGDYESSMYGFDRPDDSIPRPDPVSGPYVELFYEQNVCGNVDFILTGHDHDLQWLEEHGECEGTEQIVSGAGAKTRSAGNEDRNPAHFQQYDTLGFLWVEATETSFTGVFYDGDGNQLFERTVTKA